MSEQSTLLIKVNVRGRQAEPTESHTYRGRTRSFLQLPSLGVPGVTFAEGPTGRRARIEGTGLDVWEVIATWKGVGRNYQRLRAAYHWLTEEQLRAALEYYQRKPQAIEDRLEREEQWTPESVWQEFPFAYPSS